MFRRLICLGCFVLVLGLALTSVADAADPNLVGWWRLDDGSGTIAKDSSGNENHGTTNGNPEWEDGMIGGALHFDDASSTYVQIPFSENLRVLNQGDFTNAAWFKFDAVGKGRQVIFQQATLNGPGRSWLQINPSDAFSTWLGGAQILSGIIVEAEEWYHAAVAVTESGGTDSFQIYVNGEPAGAPVQAGMEDCEGGYLIGCQRNLQWFMDGLIDDVCIYSKALTQEEIQLAMTGIDPGLASEPSPADEATDVPREVVLNWTPGESADTHDVYFGTSFDDVNAATNLDPMGPDQVYRARQDADSYAVGERLNFGQTYYWRVDEVNAPPTSHVVFKGDVWSFTVEPVAYPVASESITATASSSFGETTGPQNTVNGSGLDADDLHSAQQADIWQTDMTAQPPIWIQYEFDKVYKLHEMWVWNFNQVFEPIVGFGLKDVTIEYSANGTDWAELAGVPEFARAPARLVTRHNTTVDFGGVGAKYVKITVNDNWGLLTQYGLSEVRFLYLPVQAKEPDPDSGATDVSVDATLGFRAGREAATHDVYLSSDEQAVIDGTAPVTTVTEASYGPLSLDLGRTYYWRVDEVNEAETPTTWQSDIWDFVTQEYLLVEGFEAYDDYEPNRVFDTWTDGWGVPTNGATMGYPDPIFVLDEHFVETTIVHSGRQSAPLFYDNTAGATYSEVTRAVDAPRDWTKAGVKGLTLWFYGDPNNSGTEQMYVKINGSKVTYDGDPADLTRRPWQVWYIDLTGLGVNLTNITELTIGLERSGAVGGKGVVYFDDIRLSPYDHQLVTPAEPNAADLLAHWSLDEGSGTTVTDVTGNGYDGTFQGDPQWATGKFGGALQFDGLDDYVIHTLPEARNFDGFTVALWVRAATLGQGLYMSPFSSHTPNSSGFQIDVDSSYPGNYRTNPGIGNHFGPVTLEWVHLVLVGEGTTVHYYYNGTWAASGTLTENDLLFNEFMIGVSRNNANFFDGAIDDFRFYDIALTPDEVAWLGGRTTPFDKPS